MKAAEKGVYGPELTVGNPFFFSFKFISSSSLSIYKREDGKINCGMSFYPVRICNNQIEKKQSLL